MKIVIQIWALLVAAFTSVHATIPNSKYDIAKENNRFLWYYVIENRFDSTALNYTFGEVEMVVGSTRTPVYISLPYADYQAGYIGNLNAGCTAKGVDTTLTPVSTTRAFTVPSGGANIQAFRMMELTSCFDPPPPSGGTPSGAYRPNNWDQARFLTGPTWYPDTTEFVIEVVKLSNGAVLGIIDSIGACPNPTTWIVPRYGTSPDTTRMNVALPSSANGQTVFLRIKSKRYGNSAYGLAMRRMHSIVNKSLLYENQPSYSDTTKLPRWARPNFTDSVLMDRFTEVIDRYDTAVVNTGCSPIIFFNEGWTTYQKGILDTFRIMHNLTTYPAECHDVWAEDTTWYMSTVDGAPMSKLSAAASRHAPPKQTPYFALTTTSNVINGGTLVVSVTGPSRELISARVVDPAGNVVRAEEPLGVAPLLRYPYDVGNLNSGSYMLLASDGKGRRQFLKFVILK